LNLVLIRTFKVPLPPIAEQHRIIAEVDELRALCDQLENQFTTAQTESCLLLEALLHEALSPVAPLFS
jgi:type I restriction enzyme, S subunit